MGTLSKKEAVAKLNRALDQIDALRALPYSSPEFDEWKRKTVSVLSHIFGDRSRQVEDFLNTSYLPTYTSTGTPASTPLGGETDTASDEKKDVRQQGYSRGLGEAKAKLQLMVEEVMEYWEGEGPEKTAERGGGAQSPDAAKKTPCVFIGHGHSMLWARLQIFLEKDLNLKTVSYEAESRVSRSIVETLESMLDEATFAVLILTAEDATAEGGRRSRQNVVHEAGLFQGRLGFKKVVILKQDGVEGFSNVDGLQYIPFAGEGLEQAFYALQ